MVADVVVAAVLTLPILIVGFILGARWSARWACWCSSRWLPRSLAFAAFGYAIARRPATRPPCSQLLLFFPFLLTSSYVPGAAHAVAQHVAWDPVTYILEGLRSLAIVGWNASDIVPAALAIAVVALLSMAMCFKALKAGRAAVIVSRSSPTRSSPTVTVPR